MATISIEIDVRDESRVFAAVAKNFNRKDRVPNPEFDPSRPESVGNSREIDNPESVEEFVNQIIENFLQEHVASFEKKEAKKKAYKDIKGKVRVKRKRKEGKKRNK